MSCAVAYLGPPASYSHQVMLQDFPEAEGFVHEPCSTIRDIFTAVSTGRTPYGVVPFENSTYGSVVDTLDLLAAPSSTPPSLRVVGESFVAVHHALLGRIAPPSTSSTASGAATPAPAMPLHPLGHITRVFSHPQALGQCQAFLGAHVARADRQETSSTSQAASLVAAHGGANWAAVASEAAAALTGLDVLARRIEDVAGNVTRFLAVRGAAEPLRVPGFLRGGGGRSKSLVLFTVEHAEPGALAAALAAFTGAGLNLSSINSRPSRRRPWHYFFFVECSGSEGDDAVQKALRSLAAVAEDHRLVGSFRVRSGEESG